MAIKIYGNGTITGLSTGGLPDGSVDADTLASSLDLGKVLQIVTASQSTQTSITSTSYVDTGLSATITPSSTSSKVLVLVSQALMISREAKKMTGRMKILRGSTDIVTHTSALQMAAGQNSDNVMGTGSPWAMTYLDSPSTTSATTYKTQAANSETTSAASLLIEPYSNLSTITLMEIAG